MKPCNFLTLLLSVNVNNMISLWQKVDIELKRSCLHMLSIERIYKGEPAEQRVRPGAA
jgi:hypothetical protein